ncbi:hypothetical protein C8Q78DRAFT_1075838 [Trametes maxima]|nr:hypothetical protein C8Q78DRAFT_1075838 [Trametes maxima]
MAGTLFQHSYYYIVNNLKAVLYGIEFVLYSLVLRLALRTPRGTPPPRRCTDRLLAAFCASLVPLNTVFWTTQA